MQKKIWLLILICLLFQASFSYGPKGHRTIAEIANNFLKPGVKKKISKLLGGEGLAFSSTFGDEIRSDGAYKKYASWHYVNFPEGKKYGENPVNKKGDIVIGVNTCIKILKDPNTSKVDKIFHLKMLIHFIGDVHQPLHVGRKNDLGGNKIKLEWFGKETNLHRVWDENMLNQYDMSYTELAGNMPKMRRAQVKDLQSSKFIDWVHESKELSIKVYESAKDGDKLSYRYMYVYFPMLRQQLHKGGIRLADVLNEIFK